MAANLITIDAGVVSPFLDAIMQELYTSGGGIITGGTITISGASTLHITQTHGALCGREFSIDDGDYTVQLSSSGTLLGRIYLHMDLANVATPLEVLVETGASLTPVVQDANVNETNGVYEINLATFEVDESTISNLVNVAPTIKTLGERTLQTVADCTNSTDPQDIAGAAVISTLNSKFAWTSLTPVTGATPVQLPNAFNEVKVTIYTVLSNVKFTVTSILTPADFDGAYLIYNGGSNGSNSNLLASFATSINKTIALSAYTYNGQDFTSSAVVKVEYR